MILMDSYNNHESKVSILKLSPSLAKRACRQGGKGEIIELSICITIPPIYKGGSHLGYRGISNDLSPTGIPEPYEYVSAIKKAG